MTFSPRLASALELQQRMKFKGYESFLVVCRIMFQQLLMGLKGNIGDHPSRQLGLAPKIRKENTREEIWDVCAGVNICPKKSETVYPQIWVF